MRKLCVHLKNFELFILYIINELFSYEINTNQNFDCLIARRTQMHNPSAALRKLSIVKKNEIESHNGSLRVFFIKQVAFNTKKLVHTDHDAKSLHITLLGDMSISMCH